MSEFDKISDRLSQAQAAFNEAVQEAHSSGFKVKTTLVGDYASLYSVDISKTVPRNRAPSSPPPPGE